jgi:hypothetical protein
VLQDMLDEQQLQAVMAATAAAGAGGGAIPAEQLQDANPLLVLLQSLLPWVNAGQQPEYDAADDGAP